MPSSASYWPWLRDVDALLSDTDAYFAAVHAEAAEIAEQATTGLAATALVAPGSSWR